MDTEQAAIIATEMFGLLRTPCWAASISPWTTAISETLTLNAKLMKAKTEATNNVLRAMHTHDADQGNHWQAEMERIDTERGERGFHQVTEAHRPAHPPGLVESACPDPMRARPDQ